MKGSILKPGASTFLEEINLVSRWGGLPSSFLRGWDEVAVYEHDKLRYVLEVEDANLHGAGGTTVAPCSSWSPKC